MRYVVEHGGREIGIEVLSGEDGTSRVRVGDEVVDADLRPAGGGRLWSLIVDGRSYEVGVASEANQVRVSLAGREVELRVESEQARNARRLAGASAQQGPQTVKSVMPGRVLRILVREGEEVAPGSSLLILEAMKMENEIRSTSAGVVTRILVSNGQTVVNGDALLTIG